MASMFNEVPTAVRRLSRAPGFSLAVFSFLSLAIAALLAMATIAYGLLWRPFGIPDDARVVALDGYSKQMGSSVGVSGPLAAELAKEFPALAVSGIWQRQAEDRGMRPTGVSAGALAALGVRPLLGRWFEPGDASSDDVVLIGERLWRSEFGGAQDVVGRTFRVKDKDLRIVGVMPAGFRFPDADTTVWLPLELGPDDVKPEDIQSFSGIQFVARLAPGVAVADVVDAVPQRYATDERLKGMREFMGLEIVAKPLRDQLAGDRRDVAALLAAAALLLVLTTLANLANLWLGRALSRQRELGIAAALGASERRIGAGVFAEVLLLTLAASAGGLALAPAVIGALRVVGVLDPASPLLLAVDARVTVVAIALAVLLAVVLAAPSWWLARRLGSMESLRQGAHLVAERPGVARMRLALIALQVAVAIALLGGGGLLLRSLGALVAEGAGFDADGLVLLQASSPLSNDPRRWTATDLAKGKATMRALQLRLEQLPDVRVSFANAPPFSGSQAVSTFKLSLADAAAENNAKTRSVGPGYFATLGLPVSQGRAFDAEEQRGAVRAVVVDERFAAKWFPGASAVGREIGVRSHVPGGYQGYRGARIVGVVANVKQARLDDRDEDGTIYEPAEAPDQVGVRFVLRSALPLADLRRLLEREGRAAGATIDRVATIDSMVWATLEERTSLLKLVGAFALAGVALCALGLYAVLAFAARRRTAEFGLKSALGAPARLIARDVLRQALALVLPGIALGAVAAFAVVRAVQSRLYGVSGADVVTWSGVAALVLLVVLAAAAGPARRAASVDPMRTLRQD